MSALLTQRAVVVPRFMRFAGQLQTGDTQVNVLLHPDVAAATAHLLDALRPFPEARLAAARALRGEPPALSGPSLITIDASASDYQEETTP